MSLLDMVRNNMQQILIPSNYSKLSAIDEEMTETCLNRIISRLFKQINTEFFGSYISNSERVRSIKDTEDDVYTTVRKLTSWIKETLVSQLAVLENFTNPKTTARLSSSSMQIMARIKLGLVHFFHSISHEAACLVRGDVYSIFQVLILARFCSELSKGGLEAVMSMYSERLFKSLDEDPGLMTTLNDLFKSSAQVLVNRFSQKVLNKMIPTLIEYYTQDDVDSITTVSPHWINLLKEFTHLDEFVSKTFNEQQEKKATKPIKVNAKKDRFTQDMDKLFAERIVYLPASVELSRKATLSTLVKCLLKVD